MHRQHIRIGVSGRRTALRWEATKTALRWEATNMNECLLRAATSGDIPRLQVLRCVPGPMRALTAPGSHSEVADLGCRSCCDLAPMSRIETGAFGPVEAQGKHADFRSTPFRASGWNRGRACVGRFAAAICARTLDSIG